MKFQASILLFAILPAFTSACALYDYCLCGDGKGGFDDEATSFACNSYKGEFLTFSDGRHYCKWGPGMDNCNFRELCQSSGGSIEGSDCWTKKADAPAAMR